jgi:hypothetical protein
VKRLLAFVVPLVLTGAPALAATPESAPHHASRARQPAPKPPVNVTFGSVGPARYLTQKSTLQVRGQLTNQSETPYQRVSVRLLYGARPLTSRGELDGYADGKGGEPVHLGPIHSLPATLPVDGRQAFTLSIAVRQMGLTGFGVYPISVEVYNAAGAVLGRQRTLVTYFPKGTSTAKTKIAWVWPVVDQPHRANDATFLDDGLERQLGGGRLSALVSAAARTPTPVSWLVDPSLVDDAAQMAKDDGYTIKGSVKRSRSVAAASWLASLHNAVGPERVIATPYADPDVASLAQRHMGKDVKAATDVAVPKLAGAGITGNAGTTVSMPPDGLTDQNTLSALAASGARTVLLSSTVLPDYGAQTYTPDPVMTKSVGGTDMRLVAYDETLRRVLASGTHAAGASVLAEQRFLAETAMITAEMPRNARTIVVTPPRRWNPDPAFAKAVLSYSAHAPWLKPVTLNDVDRLKPVNPPRAFQPQKGTSDLSAPYLRQVKDLGTRIKRFTSIFQPPESDFPLGVPRAESSAWDGHSRRGTALRKELDVELGQTARKVHVLNDADVTMAGKSARIPITISNGLDKGTVNVRLHVYSQNDTRLRVDSVDRTLNLEAGHKDQVILHMQSAANGLAYVNIELLAADGRPFGTTRVLRVRANGIGRTALLITGVSLAVLFVGVGFRVIRRRSERAEESVD